MYKKLYLSKDEQNEFDDLMLIVENVSGMKHIAGNGWMVMSGDLQTFCDRMRYLIIKNYQIGEDQELRGHADATHNQQ